jgi:hypothetical protein
MPSSIALKMAPDGQADRREMGKQIAENSRRSVGSDEKELVRFPRASAAWIHGSNCGSAGWGREIR